LPRCRCGPPSIFLGEPAECPPGQKKRRHRCHLFIRLCGDRPDQEGVCPEPPARRRTVSYSHIFQSRLCSGELNVHWEYSHIQYRRRSTRFHLLRIARTDFSVNTNCPPLRILLGRCPRSFPDPCAWSVDVSERAGGRFVSEKGRSVAAPRRATGIRERRHRCRPSVRLFGGKTDLKSTLFRAACAAAPSVT
jgi:hypothetical protein